MRKKRQEIAKMGQGRQNKDEVVIGKSINIFPISATEKQKDSVNGSTIIAPVLEGQEIYIPQTKPFKEQAKKRFSDLCPSNISIKKIIFGLFPVLDWIPNYDIKSCLVNDLIAGLTIGVVQIPQGLGYSLLCGLPPIYGIYVTFFSVLVYTLMGTSRHISMGTFAIISIMVAKTVSSNSQYSLDITGSKAHSNANETFISSTINSDHIIPDELLTTASPSGISKNEIELQKALGAAAAVTLLAGIIQIILGLLKLGFVTIYLSDQIVSGFTTGAAVHVVTSQINFFFGIKLDRHSEFPKIAYIYKDFFSKLPNTNGAEVIISALSISALWIVKDHINDRFKSKMVMPVPIDMIVVIVGTLSSYYGQLHKKYGVKTVGTIPTSFPSPSAPPADVIGRVIPDAFAIGLVSFAVNISLAKIFSKKHKYAIDANQELIAYGSGNIVCSFFSGFSTSCALSRSMIQDGVGGKTQMVGFITCIIQLVVLLALAPLFQPLPNSVLAAIIVIGVKNLFLQFRELKILWYNSRSDFFIWIICFIAVVLFDVDLGLGIGVLFALLSLVFRTQWPRTNILGRIPHTSCYKDISVYKEAEEIPGVKIFSCESALYFANVEHVKVKLQQKVGILPREVLAEKAKLAAKREKEEANKRKQEKKMKKKGKQLHSEVNLSYCNDSQLDLTSTSSSSNDLQQFHSYSIGSPRDLITPSPDIEQLEMPSHIEEVIVKLPVHHIIIDCSTFSFVDTAGIDTLIFILEDYKTIGITVFFVNFRARLFAASKFFEKIPRENIFMTVHDAVLQAVDIKTSEHLLKDSGPIDPESLELEASNEFDVSTVVGMYGSLSYEKQLENEELCEKHRKMHPEAHSNDQQLRYRRESNSNRPDIHVPVLGDSIHI